MISSRSASRKLRSNAMARWPPLIDKRAEHDRAALADAVADPAAEHRREIDEARVEAENLRGERLRRQRPERAFEHAAERREARDMLDMARQQQLVDHVEDQQRGHPVIGKALPRLGEGEEERGPCGWPKKVRLDRSSSAIAGALLNRRLPFRTVALRLTSALPADRRAFDRTDRARSLGRLLSSACWRSLPAGLVDHLGQAAGKAARADRRAASVPVSPTVVSTLRLAAPRTALCWRVPLGAAGPGSR